MGEVMIRCPNTGRDVRTGIIADRDSFNASPVFFARAYCEQCSIEHEWFAAQGWVSETNVAKRSVRSSMTPLHANPLMAT